MNEFEIYFDLYITLRGAYFSMDYTILNNIKSPADVKKLNDEQLDILCSEIRDKMIETVSHNGGHLASNLGTVELTVAIHRCFNSPKDKIVFDVSHQCYTHKLLTGRFDRFDSLRKKGGISGFARPDESEHDAFLAGHSSTSISAAFGMSQAKTIKGQGGYAVVVIGDGSLSGGLCYEALNNAGRSKDNLIVILNDNKMSISKNVGAMSKYLAHIRTRPHYYRVKERTYNFLQHVPLIGKPTAKFIMKVKSMIKGLIYNSTIFEDMGFFYLGPVDGHDIKSMSNLMNIAKDMHRPVLIHVNTVKGKGYSFAEKSATEFHGVSAFDIETGERLSSGDSFSQEFGKAACAFAENDKRICAISAAMTDSTGLAPFRKQFKNRFYDVGIAEQHAVTFAAGLSISGMVPIFAVYSTFLQRAYDQILHDAAIQNLKVVLAIDRAGIVGEDGETHQGVFDVSFLSAMPNVTIFSPCTYAELRWCLKRAIYNIDGVVAVRYPRGAEPELPNEFIAPPEEYSVFGEGADIAIVTYGREFARAVKAAEMLKNDGTAVKIIKLNLIKPIPEDAVNEALKSARIYFFEEGIKSGSVAEHFGIMLMENGFSGKYSITAIDDRFVQHQTVEQATVECKLDEKSIYDKIINDINEKYEVTDL